MNIDELMIGDWVYEMPYNNQSTKNATTVDIGILMNIAGATFFKEDYEPIPITDELLTSLYKYFCLLRDGGGKTWDMDSDGLVWIRKDDDNKYCLVVNDNTEDLPLRINATVKYLHNVQHLLREVGRFDLLDKINDKMQKYI